MRTFNSQEPEGCKVRVEESATPTDYTELYLTNMIIQPIVYKTNRYAEAFINENQEQANNSFVGWCQPVNLNEMKNELISTSVISKVMSKDCFWLNLKCLHFIHNNDLHFNPNAKDHDRLHKIQPLFELI